MSEPAFPSHGTMGEVNYEGMTLRDYFAAKAIGEMEWSSIHQDQNIACAVACYKIANAMLAAREAGQ